MRLKVDPTSLAAYLTQTDEGKQFTWNVACRLWPGYRLAGSMPGTKPKSNPGPESKPKGQSLVWGYLVVLIIFSFLAWLLWWPIGQPIYEFVKGVIQ